MELNKEETQNEEEMSHKTEKITLKVVKGIKSHVNLKPEEFRDADEGDRIGPFKLINKEEVKCNHPDVTWSVESQTTDSNQPPDITGHCLACDADLKVSPDTVEVLNDQEDNLANNE